MTDSETQAETPNETQTETGRGPTLRITYRKSAIGYSRRQKDTIRSLGFKRLGQTLEVPDNPAMRGMVRHVQHLVVVEEEVAPARRVGDR
jgi:large subunit ribosomal protein L30